MSKSAKQVLDCAHCGQPAVDKVLGDDQETIFCCFGCKVVYEILGDGTTKIPYHTLNLEKYTYLDTEKIQQKLFDFKEGDFARITLKLPQIHCSSCIYLLENLSEIEEAITNVHVHFGKKEATISYNTSKLKLSMLAALLDYIHYAPDFQAGMDDHEPKKRKDQLLIQLGVAGFFFGNTMLLAIPDYFDADLGLNPKLQFFFRVLMLVFSIPVLVFSAKDYYLNALKSLRAGFLSIDLPIALGASVLFLRSTYEVFSGLGSGYFDSLNGLIFFLLIGKWYQQKTYGNLSFERDFRSFMPLAANFISGKKEKAIPIDDLEKGDLIKVRHGEIIPADGHLQSAKAQIDYSYLTGESLPISKKSDELIYAGGKLVGQSILMEVQDKPDRSYLASLWQNRSFKKQKGEPTPKI